MFSLRNLLKKHKKEPVTPSEAHVTAASDIIIDPTVDAYIHKTASLLKVHVPTVIIVDILFECDLYGEQKVCAQQNLDLNDLPSDAAFSGGYYIDETDTILVAAKYPKPDFKSGRLTFVDHTMPELLYTVIHELRHTWQRKYHHEKFYEHNAVGMACLNDKSEIDADAFALAVIFSECTPFTGEDFPTSMEEICLQASLDNGERWKNAKILAQEYNFIEADKLSAARGSVDTNRLRMLIGLYNAQGAR